MRKENEREVYSKADDALAKFRQICDLYDVPPDSKAAKDIRHNLEIIRRRTDPARRDDYEPGE
jgi:hypothetical protein